MNKNERVDTLTQNMIMLIQSIKMSNNEKASQFWLHDLEEYVEYMKLHLFTDLFSE